MRSSSVTFCGYCRPSFPSLKCFSPLSASLLQWYFSDFLLFVFLLFAASSFYSCACGIGSTYGCFLSLNSQMFLFLYLFFQKKFYSFITQFLRTSSLEFFLTFLNSRHNKIYIYFFSSQTNFYLPWVLWV